MKIEIDSEFKALIPPLKPEEYSQLEANILADGIRDALVVWKEEGVLVDGHNRYEISQAYDLPFEVVEKSFSSRSEVIVWIIDNQAGRRNLADFVRFELMKRKGEELREKGREKQAHGMTAPGVTLLSENDKSDSHNTQKIIADDLGWSTGKVAMADVIDKEAPEEIKETLRKGELSITGAYNQIKNKPHVANNSGENEWYTPAEYIEAARLVMGSIDVDPASSEVANEVVDATIFYTKEDNGIEKEWVGNVWMNPPYSQPQISDFCNKLVCDFAAENIDQAIVLVNNATETRWFQTLLLMCSAVCFPAARVRFYSPKGKMAQPLQGQSILYFGGNSDEFNKHFSKFGKVLSNGF